MPSSRLQRFSIRSVLGILFLFCALLTALVATSLQFYFSQKLELQHAVEHYQNLADKVTTELNQLDQIATQTVHSAAHLIDLAGGDLEQTTLIKAFAEQLKTAAHVQAILVARDNDEFWQLIHLNSAFVQHQVQANPDEQWLMVLHHERDGQRVREATFYDRQLKIKRTTQAPSNFLPTLRSWYLNAVPEQVVNTPPYLFETLKVSGETFSIRLPEQQLVVAVDVVLSSLVSTLEAQFASLDGQGKAFIYQENGRVITTTQLEQAQALPHVEPITLTADQQALVDSMAVLKVSNQDDWAPFDYSVSGVPQGYSIDLFSLISQMTQLQFTYVNGRAWSELTENYRQRSVNILQPIADPSAFLPESLVGQEPLYQAEFGLLLTEAVANEELVSLLKSGQLGILSGWSVVEQWQKEFGYRFVEIDTVYQGLEKIKQGELVGLVDLKIMLEQKISEHFVEDLTLRTLEGLIPATKFYYIMPDTPNNQQLMALIDQALGRIQGETQTLLDDKWLNSSTSLRNAYVPYPQMVQLLKQPEQLQQAHLIKSVTGDARYLFINPVGQQGSEYLAVIVPKEKLMATVYQNIMYAVQGSGFVLALLIPFAWFIARPLARRIQALREQVSLIEQRRYSEVQPINTRIKEFHQLSGAIVHSSQELQRYAKAQEQFFESVIQLVARAIDEKSPYTAGHCHRVPEIALMLADAAEQSDQFDFKFNNDAEKREFRVAAWLHDCGKITTPEYVVDKGSKLETNYNRIHEIRTRFEVLWRDVQIQYLLAQQPELTAQLEQSPELKARLAQLQEEFAFIANANVGGEFMSAEDIMKVQTLAQQQWQRNFDAGLGLSPLEQTRYQPRPTPAMEPLLVDRPEHIIAREHPLELDEKYGIQMQVPEHLYNLGEVYNLSVQRGTLTNEERFKINEHMISGIKMLDSIPFPEELAKVPRYASTHHEMMNGRGYPRGLSAEQLSLPERLLMVADVFEALTAADRPYKQAKSLSATMSIMVKMAQGQHLDPQVVKLLLTSGVYLQYAEQYLAKEQIDTIDIDSYLAQLDCLE